MAPRFGRSSLDPRFGSIIELHRGHLHRAFNLIGIGKTLASEGIAPEQTPPLLKIEPARPFGNKDMLDTWMLCEPGARLQAVMAAQIVRDDEDVPLGAVGFDGLEPFNVILGITRSRERLQKESPTF